MFFKTMMSDVRRCGCLALWCLTASAAWAADKTWSGGGADNNWSTGANWSGAAPVNADNLIFSGGSQMQNSNDLSNLTVGWVRFASAGFDLSGNPLTLSPATAGIFTNLSGVNVIANDLTITTASKYWSIAANSELRLTGNITNTTGPGASAGWVGMTNDGVLRIMGEAKSDRGMDLFRGTVIVDGGSVQANNDGIRFKPQNGLAAALQITNNGTVRVGGGGNFRMGNSGAAFGAAGAAGGISHADLSSGTLELYGANVVLYVGDNVAGAKGVFNQNGGLVWGSAGSGNTLTLGGVANGDGVFNLNGGTLWIAQVRQGNASATNVVFNFNGGTLKPTVSSTTFLQGLLNVNVQNGGAVIDTTNLNITIAQNLQAAGAGGLTKLGTGALTLAGANSYTGPTIVSNGTLLVNGQLNGSGSVNVFGGTLGGTGTMAGSVTIAANAALAPGVSVGTLTLQNNLTLGGDLRLEVDKSLPASNDVVQVTGSLGNTGSGTVLINNLGPALMPGDNFQFFNKPLANGNMLVLSPATPGAGLVWTNKLAVDGSVGVVGVAAGTGADLSALSLSAGAVTPTFSSNVYNYSVTVAYTNQSIAVTPVSATNTATIRVIANGTTNVVTSGATSSALALHPGPNAIIVRVAAPDNLLTKDYVVTITRTPPNVVVVLMDDLGFSDLGSYGGEIPTPHMDSLAAGGLRFRQFYNTARCSTTRCSLLTGTYSHQVSVDPAQALPNLREDNNVTLAELLGANGYRTYLAGKWHLGGGVRAPEARGFQQVWRFASATAHSADTWNTNAYTLVSPDGAITNRMYAAGTFYQTDAIGDYSLDFLNHHAAQGDQKPFLLYMAFGAPHFPIQAPKSTVDPHVPVYAAGWDALRQQRYTNMLAQGVIDARHPLSARGGTGPHGGEPVEEIPAWNTLAADRQADLARRMAIYAAMTQKLDENVGRVVEQLRQQGQLDNTVIFIMSDNGGNHEGGRFGQTGNTVNAAPLTGLALENMGLNGQPNIHIGGGWANVNNTPFRISKHFNHEGGIRSPLIIHWPQGGLRTNQWSEQVSHLMDIMATIVDVTGVSYPTQFNNHPVLPLEGISLKPQFTSTNAVARSIGFEHEVNRAWREGDWKFVTKNFALYDGSSAAHELELYNLATDPVELTNLAYAQPQLVATLASNWNTWASRVGVPAGRLLTTFTNTPPPVVLTPAPNANDLFLDTFARSNQNDIDLSATGMSGSRVPPLGANNAYYEGFEGSGSPANLQINNGALVKAAGGMIESGIMHNFIGADIVAAGGFSVELTVQSINSDGSDAANRYVGFGVGLSQTEAASGWDINSAITGGAVAFRGSLTGNTGVADFFVELDLNGNVKVWRNGALLDTVPVGQNIGTLTATFACAGFSTNDTVTVKVFFNGQPVDINTADGNSTSRTFQWDRNDSNYIGLSSRASNSTQMDNLAIRKLPVTPGLAIGYALQHGLTGANSAPEADPDGDGVVNFGEWAFGGDPTAANPSIAMLKGVQVTPAQDFQFEFQRLSNAASFGLQYRYFISENLGTWTPTTPVIVSVAPSEDNPGYEVVAVKLPAATLANTNKLFLRVLAEPLN